MTESLEQELAAAREKLQRIRELVAEIDRGPQHGNLWIIAVQLRDVLGKQA